MTSPPDLTHILVQLGRMGDIINVLPLAWHLREQTGRKPGLMVAEPFASLLEGVSYVEPIVAKSPFEEPLLAVGEAKARWPKAEVLCTQVYGNKLGFERRCESFTKESWRRVGMLPLWGMLPLVFDRRDAKREAALLRKVRKHDTRPMVLVNLGGKSSPFPWGRELLEDVRFRWGRDALVVDLQAVKAERLYDLLVLYDDAAVLLTGDTGTWHLAAASKVPVVALRVDTPTLWHGAVTHRQAVRELRYSETMTRREKLHITIAAYLNWPDTCHNHLFLDHYGEGETLRRNLLARRTWETAYNPRWSQLPVLDEQLPRLFACNERRLPYIKDVIDFGLAHHPSVVLTNTDTCFAPDIEARLVSLGHGHRRDFGRLDRPLSAARVATGALYPGSDLFCLDRTWWRKHRDEMPDLIFGAEAWDCCLRVLMQQHGGVEIKDAIYHERHASRWEQPANRGTLPSQLHCRKLAQAFLRERSIDPALHGL